MQFTKQLARPCVAFCLNHVTGLKFIGLGRFVLQTLSSSIEFTHRIHI